MGQTRVIFTDATTAEAISVLKTLGFYETADGGCYLSSSSPIKIYTAWGKARYYPDLLEQLTFVPRVQVHFKCSEQTGDLPRTISACSQAFINLAPNTLIKIFDINTGEEIPAGPSRR